MEKADGKWFVYSSHVLTTVAPQNRHATPRCQGFRSTPLDFRRLGSAGLRLSGVGFSTCSRQKF